MLIKTRGIIFRTKKYSETSVIADIYTEAKGLRSYIISGVRSKKAKVQPSLLQVMSLVDLVVYHRDDRTLTRLKEIKSAHVFQSIPFEVQKGAVGMFMVEIARKSIRESEEHATLFDYLFSSFQYLDQTSHSIANLHLHFTLGLTAFLGFLPSGKFDEIYRFFDLQEGVFEQVPPKHSHFLNEQLSQLLGALLKSSMEQCHEIKMSRNARQMLLQHLLDFYALHMENFPTIYSHEILQEVLG